MDREVFMGDETREILRSEVIDHERNGGAPTSARTPDAAPASRSSRRSTLPPPAASRSPVSPWGANKERRRYTAPRPSSTSAFGSHYHLLDDEPRNPRLRPPEHSVRTPASHALDQQVSAKHTATLNISDTAQPSRVEDPATYRAKRRRVDHEGSKLPELDLEIDVGLDLFMDESLHDTLADPGNSPQLHHLDSLSSSALPKRSVERESEVDAESLRGQVETLKRLLVSKQEHIQALQAELQDREEQHLLQIQKIKQDLHREYSKQASEKLRVIIKRLELSAKKRAEQDWKDRVSKLSEVVDNERNEKAELVQACDEYLRLKGF